LRVLHDDLHLERLNLFAVLHSLEADQMRSRAELSRELLHILEQDQQYELEHRLTGDESWCFVEDFHHSCSATNTNDIPETPKQKFNPKSVSFRLFGVAEGSKVGCVFRKA
jgi:hypothetical protein